MAGDEDSHSYSLGLQSRIAIVPDAQAVYLQAQDWVSCFEVRDPQLLACCQLLVSPEESETSAQHLLRTHGPKLLWCV